MLFSGLDFQGVYIYIYTETPHLEFHCDPSSKLKVVKKNMSEAAVEDHRSLEPYGWVDKNPAALVDIW